MRFHFTRRGNMHEGASDSCAKCMHRRRVEYQRSREGKVDGRTLNRKYPPGRTCTQCGTSIKGRNKSGLCVVCLRTVTAEQAKARRARRRALHAATAAKCSVCGISLNYRNTSGLCRTCYAAAGLHGRKSK